MTTILILKATLALLLALAGGQLLRRSRAATRHVVLAATFFVLLALPVVATVAPAIPITVPVKAQEEGSATYGERLELERFINPSPVEEPEFTTNWAASAPTQSFPIVIPELLAVGWTAGTVVFFIPFLIGLYQMRSLRKSGKPWSAAQSLVETLARESGIRRRVGVMLHGSVAGPMTCGVAKPVVMLPVSAQTWSEDDLRRAVIHELEHVRRCDWLLRCIARAVCAFYWFHPLVWLAWRRFVLEGERACDDAVLQHTEATTYADQLVVLAQDLSTRRLSTMTAMAGGGDLAKRVRSLLDIKQKRGRAGAWSVAMAVVAVLLFVASISPLQVVFAAQTNNKRLAFEVASIRQNESGTPGSNINVTPAEEAVGKLYVQNREQLVPVIGAIFQSAAIPIQSPVPQIPMDSREAFEVASVRPTGLAPGNAERGGGGGGVRRSLRPAGEPCGDGGPAFLQINDRRFAAHDMTLHLLVTWAYGMKCHIFRGSDLLFGGPNWTKSDGFDIQALIPADTPSYTKQQFLSGGAPQLQKMLQNLLADRFKLVLRRETREMQVYILTAPKGGSKLTPWKDGDDPRGDATSPSYLTGRKRAMAGLASSLAWLLDRPVLDRTGLAGEFNYSFSFAPLHPIGVPWPPPGPSQDPSIFTSLEELGLKLDAARAPVEVVVIQSVEKPSEN